MKDFAHQLLTKFTVSDQAARFGVVQFSTEGTGRIEIGLSGSTTAIDAAVTAMTELTGNTDIQEGLALGRIGAGQPRAAPCPLGRHPLDRRRRQPAGRPDRRGRRIEAERLKPLRDRRRLGCRHDHHQRDRNRPRLDPRLHGHRLQQPGRFREQHQQYNLLRDDGRGPIAGSAYVDGGNDGVKGPSDPGIPGTTVILGGDRPVRPGGASHSDDRRRRGISLRSAPARQLRPDRTAARRLSRRPRLSGHRGRDCGQRQDHGDHAPFRHQATGYNFGEHRAPAFTTNPVLEVKAGAAYSYDADTSDLEKDPIAYALIQGPAGLAVSSTTGVVTWGPVTGDVGNHKLVIRASDGRGGTADQTFTLTVLSGYPNRPPRFTSTPIVDAWVGIPYAYQAAAMDPDGDTPLTYDLIAGPAGLAVSTAGLVSWSATNAQLGTQTVTLRVSDNRAVLPNTGGTDTQTYTILVRQSPGNHPPVIIGQPSTIYRPPVQTRPSPCLPRSVTSEWITPTSRRESPGRSPDWSRTLWGPTAGRSSWPRRLWRDQQRCLVQSVVPRRPQREPDHDDPHDA